MKVSEVRKKTENALRPIATKAVIGALQGYVFGCVVGLFTQHRGPRISAIVHEMHGTGKKFAVVGGVYSGTEAFLERYQGKRALNSAIASAVSGTIAQRQSGPTSMAATAAIFALYNSAYQVYGFK